MVTTLIQPHELLSVLKAFPDYFALGKYGFWQSDLFPVK